MANSRAKTNRDTDGFVKVIAEPNRTACSVMDHFQPRRNADRRKPLCDGVWRDVGGYRLHLPCPPTHAEALKEAAWRSG